MDGPITRAMLGQDTPWDALPIAGHANGQMPDAWRGAGQWRT
jgi:hypothetical protein